MFRQRYTEEIKTSKKHKKLWFLRITLSQYIGRMNDNLDPQCVLNKKVESISIIDSCVKNAVFCLKPFTFVDLFLLAQTGLLKFHYRA